MPHHALQTGASPCLQLPYESLKRDARDNRKSIIENLQRATSKVAKLSSDPSVSAQQATAALQDLRKTMLEQREAVRLCASIT